MTCDEVRELIDREGAITSGEANSHVHECPGCQEFWDHWQAVRKELHAMGEEDTPPFLHTRIMAHVQEAAESERTKGAWLFGLRKIWAGPILVLFVGILLGGYGLFQVLHPRGPSQPLSPESGPISPKQQPRAEAKAKDIPPAPDFFKSGVPAAGEPRETAPAPPAPSATPSAAVENSSSIPQPPAGDRPADLQSTAADGKKDSLFATPPPLQEKGAAETGAFQPLANRFEERAAPAPAAAPSKESSRASALRPRDPRRRSRTSRSSPNPQPRWSAP